jgi:hypothetical protein
MSEGQSIEWPWFLLCIPFAPFLLFVMMVAIPTSALAGRIFGTDPVALMARRHPQVWTVLLLTGFLTFALMLLAVLLGNGF